MDTVEIFIEKVLSSCNSYSEAFEMIREQLKSCNSFAAVSGMLNALEDNMLYDLEVLCIDKLNELADERGYSAAFRKKFNLHVGIDVFDLSKPVPPSLKKKARCCLCC